MIRNLIKSLMIMHNGIVAPLCRVPSRYRQVPRHDVKRHLAVFHFSVLALESLRAFLFFCLVPVADPVCGARSG